MGNPKIIATWSDTEVTDSAPQAWLDIRIETRPGLIGATLRSLDVGVAEIRRQLASVAGPPAFREGDVVTWKIKYVDEPMRGAVLEDCWEGGLARVEAWGLDGPEAMNVPVHDLSPES